MKSPLEANTLSRSTMTVCEFREWKLYEILFELHIDRVGFEWSITSCYEFNLLNILFVFCLSKRYGTLVDVSRRIHPHRFPKVRMQDLASNVMSFFHINSKWTISLFSIKSAWILFLKLSPWCRLYHGLLCGRPWTLESYVWLIGIWTVDGSWTGLVDR